MLTRFDEVRNIAKNLYEWEFYHQAIETLQIIPEKDFSLDDWRKLATYQNNYGFTCQYDKKKLFWYEKAIASMMRIPEKDFTPTDWCNLAKYQNKCGEIYTKNNEWENARKYFHSSLDSLNYLSAKNCYDYTIIVRNYDHLRQLSLESSIEQQLYSFAHNIFSGKKQTDFQTQFLQLHLAILNSSYLQPNSLLSSLLQLMRLIKTDVNQADFPNERMKKWWLSDANQFQQFEKMLQEIEQRLSKPLSLLDAASQAPTFPLAVASKLAMLEDIIGMLKEEINSLKEENQQLKNSTYQNNHLVLFRNECFQSKEKQGEVNQTHRPRSYTA